MAVAGGRYRMGARAGSARNRTARVAPPGTALRAVLATQIRTRRAEGAGARPRAHARRSGRVAAGRATVVRAVDQHQARALTASRVPIKDGKFAHRREGEFEVG